MLMPAGPPALIISGLAELAKISEVERMTIAKTLTVGSGTDPVLRTMLTTEDYVCAVAVYLLYDYGGHEGVRGGVGSEAATSCLVAEIE